MKIAQIYQPIKMIPFAALEGHLKLILSMIDQAQNKPIRILTTQIYWAYDLVDDQLMVNYNYQPNEPCYLPLFTARRHHGQWQITNIMVSLYNFLRKV
jgi:hypothetical protein